ncbi:MAG: hypothetical protein ACOYMQ_04010 [Pseudanabaena sp.]|jgi:hypothetical protein
MNFAILERKLAQLKPSKRSLAKSIYEQRLQNSGQKFQSIEDVIINVSGIKETTMQKMIDAWQFMKYCFGHQNLLLGKEFK